MKHITKIRIVIWVLFATVLSGIYSLLVVMDTPIHELGHIIIFKSLNVPITKVKWIDLEMSNGTLGSVAYNITDIPKNKILLINQVNYWYHSIFSVIEFISATIIVLIIFNKWYAWKEINEEE